VVYRGIDDESGCYFAIVDDRMANYWTIAEDRLLYQDPPLKTSMRKLLSSETTHAGSRDDGEG
jgi:hypothetical protein